MPPKEAAIKLVANTNVQLDGHGMQCELPIDMLRPGWHVPQSTPEWPLAHCASAPFGELKLILMLKRGGFQ